MTPMFKRKVLVVAAGLLIFLSLTYKYHESTPTSWKVENNPTPPQTFSSVVHKDNHLEENRTSVTDSGDKNTQKSVKKLEATRKPKSFFANSGDHFADWPSPSHKHGCLQSYSLKSKSLSIIIYLQDIFDSLPMQTFLSVLQFAQESQLTISNVICTFVDKNGSSDVRMKMVRAMMKLSSPAVPIITTSAASEWKAKLKAVHITNSDHVFMVDDTVIVNRGYIRPLLSLLESKPTTLVIPHVDSLLPSRIYMPYKDKKLHPDGLIWQETSVATHHVTVDMIMSRKEHKMSEMDSPELSSGGLNGEALAGHRTHLISLLSKMKTDEPAELSLLSYMCGDGILVTKCSAVVRSNNYELLAPKTHNAELLQELYPLTDTNPNKQAIEGCSRVNEYFQRVKKFTDI